MFLRQFQRRVRDGRRHREDLSTGRRSV